MLNSIADIAEFIAVIIESGLTVEELNQALGVFNEIMIGDLYRLSHRLYQFLVFGFLTETQTRLLGELTARATAELFVIGSFVVTGTRTISVVSRQATVMGRSLVANRAFTVPRFANRGTTGRTTPRNLFEQMFMNDVRTNPLNGAYQINLPMNDPRWLGSDGWVKMQRTNFTAGGDRVTIHFNFNQRLHLVDDFKFTYPN